MKYLKRRKWELLFRAFMFSWGLWGSIYFAVFMLTENPKIDYLSGTFLTICWLFTCWFTIDMGRTIWKIVKENLDAYEKAQANG